MLRVIIAEDERPARAMLAALVRASRDLELIAETDCGEGLAALLTHTSPDVILVDDDLPQLDAVPLPAAAAAAAHQRPIAVWLTADCAPCPTSAASPLTLDKPVVPREFAQMMDLVSARITPAPTDETSVMWPNLMPAARPDTATDAPAAVTSHPDQAQAPPHGEARATKAPRRGLRPMLALVAVALTSMYLFFARPGDPGADDGDILIGVNGGETGRYQPVSFATLSGFDYANDSTPRQIPEAVRDLGGHKVALRGFMLPLDVNEQGVGRFLLNSNYDMCQFGAPTGSPNQWVEVRMAGAQRAPYVHTPVVVMGTLDVGEVRSQGRLVSLYRLVADTAAVPR